MGVSAKVVWEVRTTGAITNGGGFNATATGTDWSQQDAAQYALTAIASAGAGNVFATALAAADMIGNIAQVVSGTNFTAGFFEIVGVSVGVNVTCSTSQAGAAISTGVGASGVINIGGAYKISGATDTVFAAGTAPGNTVWIKAGSYTATNNITFTDGTNAAPNTLSGYNASRGDAPAGTNRPLITLGTTTFNTGTLSVNSHIRFTGSAATMCTSDGQNSWYNCKLVNTSTAAGRNAIAPGSDDLIANCEITCYNGFGVTISGDLTVTGCYIHDCATGIREANTGAPAIIVNNIIAGCFTAAIQFSAGETAVGFVYGNTIYGAENKLGTGLSLAASASDIRPIGNIFYGCTIGISAAANTANYALNNDFFNNASNSTNFGTGVMVQTLAPSFANVALVSGTASGTIAASTLTDAAANFNNVVDSQDFCYISAGTGATAGQYLITSHTSTSVTLGTAPGGSGTDITYRVRTGQNFMTGGNLNAYGFPGAFPGGLTTGYSSIGAAQPVSSAANKVAGLGQPRMY